MGNFGISTAEGPLVNMTVTDLATFTTWIQGPGAVKEPVSGLGDAAYCGPKTKEVPTLLAFRSGSRAVRLVSTRVDDDGARVVSNEQVRELADLIASRME